MRAPLILLVLVASARGAAAHPLDLGYLRIIQAGDTVAITLDLDVNAAAILVGVPALDAPAVAANAPKIAAATLTPISTPAGACTWGPAAAKLVGRTATLTATATCAGPGERRWTFPFVHDHRISTKFELLVKEVVGESERLTLVDPSKSEIALAAAAPPPPPKGSRTLVIGLAITISAIGVLCVILLRWRRRSTSTT